MRKFVVAAMSGLFMAGIASAQSVSAPPPVAAAPAADPQNILNFDLSTGGRVKILLRPDKAPYSVDRIKTLVRRQFYDGLIFHRVIDGFMAQGGDPRGTGEGGSDLPDMKAEFNDLPHVRGTLSLARAEGLDSANSQFFIMLQPNLNLDGNYTAIGRVIAGMEYVDALEKGEPPEKPSKIVRASIESDELGQPPAAFVVPPPAPPAAEPVTNDKQARKAKKQEDKLARQQAKEEAKEKAKKAKQDAKAAKESREQAAKEAKRNAKTSGEPVESAPAPAAEAPLPVESVPPPVVEAPLVGDPAPAPESVTPDKEALKARELEEKRARQAAEDDAKAAARKAREEAKAAAAAEKQAAREKAQAEKAAKAQAEQAEKDAKKAAREAEKAAREAAKAQPAPAVESAVTPQAMTTDQAVQAVSDQASTDAAVQAVSADETVAQPQ
jgi:cyclophilin family peptidyl-prolyl cis-trans isomerase